MDRPRGRRPAGSHLEGPAFTEKDLRELYKEKLRFCREVLHLPKAKAEEWAARSIEAFRSAGELKQAS